MLSRDSVEVMGLRWEHLHNGCRVHPAPVPRSQLVSMGPTVNSAHLLEGASAGHTYFSLMSEHKCLVDSTVDSIVFNGYLSISCIFILDLF